jgi:Ca2+/Na+ antiporter
MAALAAGEESSVVKLLRGERWRNHTPSTHALAHAIAKEEPDEPDSTSMQVFKMVISPLPFAFRWTMPDASIWTEEDNEDEGRPADAQNPTEWLWPFTFVVSFLWVSVFSFVISAIADRWCDLLNVDMAFFGMVLVAGGAEIPDTIQSVTVAKRGYGAMAVSNCIGSQICNICLGLGMPWFISNAALNAPVYSIAHKALARTASFQLGIVLTALSSLLGMAILQGKKKAELSKFKGKVFMAIYFIVLICLAIFQFGVDA